MCTHWSRTSIGSHRDTPPTMCTRCRAGTDTPPHRMATSRSRSHRNPMPNPATTPRCGTNLQCACRDAPPSSVPLSALHISYRSIPDSVIPQATSSSTAMTQWTCATRTDPRPCAWSRHSTIYQCDANTRSSTCLMKLSVSYLISDLTPITRPRNSSRPTMNTLYNSGSYKKSLYISFTTSTSSTVSCCKSLFRLSLLRSAFRMDCIIDLTLAISMYPFSSSLGFSSTINFFRMKGSNNWIEVLNC